MEEQVKIVNLPRLNEPAPEFEAVTTFGKIKLSDFRGKWIVLFSHPSDFTPVCTTEFVAFSKANDEFVKRNVQLIGLSIDSIFSHLAWVKNIEKNFGIKVPFPIIEDIDMKVATLYGMVHPKASSTQAVRAVFIIDDKGILRAMIYYPQSNGRNIQEIIRLVDALQTTDKYGVSTPANWTPGEKVVVPPPKSQADMEKRLTEDYECVDWYLCFKKI
ncbi:MAG TPA: peroxiredoxin [bacterium]|jgi:peroxiredoxin (alkyl hydroperoxide reductase subunit C)|nr:peroxiredoxin [Dictyoglomota bacterium]HHV80703.1 peroxiredoxin [bacterium]HOL55753.1 peroxiredoxin [bacterium]HON72103.1 peroxiredoxin [bacterium]HOP56422.1 peroxiredoxin [bacterium]